MPCYKIGLSVKGIGGQISSISNMVLHWSPIVFLRRLIAAGMEWWLSPQPVLVSGVQFRPWIPHRFAPFPARGTGRGPRARPPPPPAFRPRPGQPCSSGQPPRSACTAPPFAGQASRSIPAARPLRPSRRAAWSRVPRWPHQVW